MKTVQIEIPKEIVLSLKIPYASVKRQLTEELAIHLYREDFLSFRKAGELASLSKWKFAQRLGSKKIPRNYTEDDLEEYLRFAEEK
jgi:predicted HTH domain antitoxin